MLAGRLREKFRHCGGEAFARAMGLLDRLLGKKSNGPAPAVEPTPSPVTETPSSEAAEVVAAKPLAGPTLPRLASAREKLGEKDLAGALASV